MMRWMANGDSAMAQFSVLLLTAAPPGISSETGGAFVKIDGRESVLRCAELFLNRDNVKQIQVVVLPGLMEEAKRKYGGHLSLFGVKLISAGPGWIDQIAGAAEKIAPDCTHVIVHDAARPAVSYTDIEALMASAEKYPAVVLTAPLRSNLIEVDEGGNPLAQRSSSEFVQLLTPQVFARDRLMEIARSKQPPHASSLHLLKGSVLNLRIGAGSDAGLIKQMLNLLPKPKIKAPASPFEEAQW
jgi:2-C-methyl-D-erythritol 4-phosphate cytidylyltransferase